VEILEQGEGTVVAFLSGHYHSGGIILIFFVYCLEGYVQHNGIHYWCLKGILEAPNGNNCFAIVNVFGDRLEIKGYGTERTMTMYFKSQPEK